MLAWVLRFKNWRWLWPTLWGSLLGVLPHLTQRLFHGTWVFQSSNDDHYYAMIARSPFLGSWSLRDPFANTSEAIGVSYAWGLFVPMAKLTALFGSSPADFLLGWRLLGGGLLGLGTWLLISSLLRRSAPTVTGLAGAWGVAGLSAVVASTLVADPGLDRASLPFEHLVVTAAKLFPPAAPFDNAARYVQFRIVSPLCGLGILFAALAVLCGPRLKRRSAMVLGLLLGLLFNLYFFYWTTLVGLILALAFVQCLPGRIRRWFAVRQPPRLLGVALAIGIVIGLPQLLGDFSSFGDPVIKEALERTPRGLALSWNNPARWLYLTGPRLWLDCALVTFAAIRVRVLRVPALLVMVSFALGNSAIITGLQFENYKWLHSFHSVSYLCLWLWALVEGGRFIRHRPGFSGLVVRRALLTVLGICGALALLWIPRECLSAPEAAARTRWLAEIQGLQPIVASFRSDASVVLPKEAQPALLFGSCGALYEPAYSTQSFISDNELIDRHVLSAWVLNENRSELYLRSDLSEQISGETRPRWQRLRDRYAKSVDDTTTTALDRFRVRYALTLCSRPPNPETGDWHPLGRAKLWCAWERRS